MKAILIVVDGLGDRQIKELGNRTPLEAVEKPALDTLARLGVNGIMDTISPGTPPGSDTAHLAIFGYNPHTVYRGRGVFEALGSGIEVGREDVAFRCNFATVDGSMTVTDRRAGRISTEEAAALSQALTDLELPDSGLKLIFRHSTEHRGSLLLRGGGVSYQVSDSDPEDVGRKVNMVTPLDDSPDAKRTAEAMNEMTAKTYELLRNHPVNEGRVKRELPPANILLFRGAGRLPDLTPMTEIYKIRASCVVPNALVRGVAMTAGMKPVFVPTATGTVKSDLGAKAEAAVRSLPENDLVFIHVKGVDNASHDGNLAEKMAMIGKVDGMVRYLLDHTDPEEVCIAITADHATPVKIKRHTGDPVPLALMGGGVVADDVSVYSERACARGGLGRIRGVDLVPTLMNLLGKTEKFGA